MTRIITIRPEPGSTATVQGGKRGGLTVEAFPLSEVLPRAWEGPSADDVDALLVGSSAAFRNGGPELERYKNKPVFAVGATTAAAAREAGFRVELAGQGGLQKLLDMIEHRPIRLLRLAGARHIDIDLPGDVHLDMRILYEGRDLPMSEQLVESLARDALVLLHSAGAAEHFCAECDRLGIDRSKIRIAAMGPRIAEAAGDGWAELRHAPQPADGALLALAAQMCH